jgi:endonuclease YncB( thermonuclease family)
VRGLVCVTLLVLLTPQMAACASAAVATPEASATVVASPTQPAPQRLSYVDTSPVNGLSALRCEDCPVVGVVEVLDAETIHTDDGPVRLYGVFVSPQEQNCFDEATARLRALAGMSVRLEPGSEETDSAGTPIRYVYTSEGDSIDEIFISEGLARTSAFEGPHAPWLLITAENSRQTRSGCIWENYDRLFPHRTPTGPG